MSSNRINLREVALSLFAGVFQTIDAETAVQNAVKLQKSQLHILEETIDLSDFSEICVVSFGKAAIPMAIGLDKILAGRITQGLVSAPKRNSRLSSNWKVFVGGHPVPNKSSLKAAKSTIELLEKANNPQSLVIFLISGGGSAMLELPKDEKISLKDLQKTNQILVNCGATINEINRFRRAISRIKGGGLSRVCPLARRVSLVISDTNAGDVKSVASGPTIEDLVSKNLVKEAIEIAEKYKFKNLQPKSVIEFLESNRDEKIEKTTTSNHSIYTLLDNQIAVESIAESAEKSGFITEIADELIENPIEEGCLKLVERLLDLRNKNKGKSVAIISGGEFVCPVRGSGIGGRNLETVLRCLLEVEKQTTEKLEFAILSGGTDGIDGNSPATGSVVDETTLKRAKELGFNPEEFLSNSDSYNFFRELGDMIVTGTTGTNVRDVRILLAR